LTTKERFKRVAYIVLDKKSIVNEFFRYLHLTGDTYGRPIHGQKEISCYSYANSQNIWKADAGVYIRSSSEPLSSTRDDQFNTRSQSTHTDHFDDEL
jgi:hypothetical protein